MFFHGDLNKMYLEEEEEIEKEVDEENKKQHDKFKVFVNEENEKNKYHRGCDDYYDEEE